MKYSLDQWLTILAALIFLVGGAFMLVNVFGGETWAFIVGISLAVVASLVMGGAMLYTRQRVKKNLAASAPVKTEEVE